MEACGGGGVVRVVVRVVLLCQFSVCGFDLRVGCAGIEAEGCQRLAFWGEAVFGERAGLSEASAGAFFLGGACGGFFGAEAGEVVPALVVFCRVFLAEPPFLVAVGGFWGGAVAGLAASFPIAQAHGFRLAFLAVGAPAWKAPVQIAPRARHFHAPVSHRAGKIITYVPPVGQIKPSVSNIPIVAARTRGGEWCEISVREGWAVK